MSGVSAQLLDDNFHIVLLKFPFMFLASFETEQLTRKIRNIATDVAWRPAIPASVSVSVFSTQCQIVIHSSTGVQVSPALNNQAWYSDDIMP